MRIAAKRLREFFGGARRANQIATDEITQYQKHRREQGMAPGTINYETAILRGGLVLAERADKLAKRPYFAMLQTNNVRKGFFERGQLDAVLRHLPADTQPVALIAYLTGWRARSELLTRQWRHVDLINGWLRLEPGESKNGEGGAFPFSVYPELRDALLAQRARVLEIERRTGRSIPWVFCRDDGSRIVNYSYAWDKAVKVANLTSDWGDGKPHKLIVHDFRRTAVRNLERAGVSRSAAMRLTGHKTESIYRRYAIVDSTMLEEAVAKVAAFGQSKAKVREKTLRPAAESPTDTRVFDA
jgi:integrase